MKPAHTPAPWLVEFDRYEYDSRRSTLQILDSHSLDHPQGPLTIATVNVAAHAPHLDEPLANAALIAAAPALLAALQGMLEYFCENGYDDYSDTATVQAARAAIRQATELPADQTVD